MARLINRKRDKALPDKPGTQWLFVRGVRYANTAAKFWPSLIDEVREDFPDCSIIELAASTSGELERENLFPEIAFEKDFYHLLTADMQEEMRNILAELEIMGPPCSVQIRLLRGKKELLSSELPLDCIDAEIFPFLIVWLLEWAGIPEFQWNNEFLEGNITAEDKKRRLLFRISFSLNNRHLSEGLYQRSISLVHSVIGSQDPQGLPWGVSG